MLILTTFETLPTITASTSNAQYPVSNIAQIDPGRVWQPTTFTAPAPAWIVVDYGSAKSLTDLFLNNCNFTSATIQGNDTDSWTTPAFSQAVTLAKDDCQVRKGYFTLTAFNYRYLRILITFQTLDNSATYPFIGNLITGTATTLKVSEWAPQKIKRYSVFQSDGGSYSKTPKGKARHTFGCAVSSTLATVESINWDYLHAVVYEDLGNVAGSWLVYHPNEIGKSIKNTNDASLRLTFEERV